MAYQVPRLSTRYGHGKTKEKIKVQFVPESDIGKLYTTSDEGLFTFSAIDDEEMDGHVTMGHQGTMDEQLQAITTEFDSLQIWYSLSPPWRRFTLQMLGILVFALIGHIAGFLLAIFYIDKSQGQVQHPYVCETEHCKTVSEFLKETMDTSVKPCDDFYQYVCGKYPETQKAEVLVDHNEYFLLTTLQSDVTERKAYGAVFHDTENPMNYQINTFFESCLNHSSRNELGDKPFLEMLDDMGLNLDNPTKSLSEIMYQVWYYTGRLGIFRLHLYFNPYDGFKKFQILNKCGRICGPFVDRKSDKVLSKSESEERFLQDFKDIVKFLHITKYSAEEIHAALHVLVKHLISPPDDVQHLLEEKNKFNCDVFSERLDPSFGQFELDNMQDTFGDGSKNLFGSINRKFADFVCNGHLVKMIAEDLATSNYPSTIDFELTLKSFWIIHTLQFFITDLTEMKEGFNKKGLFEDELSEKNTPPAGAQCLRSLKYRMPHLVHERLMQVYDVSEEKIIEVHDRFQRMHNRLSEWLHHPDRKKSFGQKTLDSLTGVVDWYLPKPYNFRFSVKQLEDFGYGETAKEMNPNTYLENIKRLRGVNVQIALKHWRGIEKKFIPIGVSSFRYSLQEMTVAQTIFRPLAQTSTLIPALTFSPLYYNGDILSIQYGSIYTFLMMGVFNAWRNTCDDQGVVVDDTTKCTIIKKGSVGSPPIKDTVSISDKLVSHSGVERGGWLDVIVDLLMEMYESELKERENQNIFGYQHLIHMEMFTPEQLFFLKLTRHSCSLNDDVIQDVRSGLARSTSFSKAWNCPPDSIMNAEYKCLTSPKEISQTTNTGIS